MTEVDQVLIAPARAELEAALAAAAAAVNGRARERLLAWPPDDLRSFRKEIGAAPEGYRQWVGGGGPQKRSPYGRAGLVRSALTVAWWSDHVGRRHVRLLGRRALLGLPALVHLMWPAVPQRGGSVPPVPALALVYRDFTFLRVQGGQRRVRVVCRCGVSGVPGAVGWMGDCCGPCHDRRQSGEGEAPAAAGAFTLRPAGRVGALAFSPDGNMLLVGLSNRLLVWDVPGGRERFSLPCDRPVWEVAVAANGSALVAAGNDRVWFWGGLPEAPRPPDITSEGARPPSVALAPDGSALAFGADGLGVEVLRRPAGQLGWKGGRAAPRPQRCWQGDWVSNMTFAPDGTALAAAVHDEDWSVEARWSVRLWDAGAGRPLSRTFPSQRQLRCLVFAPDGGTLAVGAGGTDDRVNPGPGEVELWDVRAGARMATLGPHTGVVTGVAFLPDGRRLLSADLIGGQVRLWDVTAGREDAVFEWHQHPLAEFALSPDGRWLATGDNGGFVRLWPVEALCAP
jgi:WD40 repeat protein